MIPSRFSHRLYLSAERITTAASPHSERRYGVTRGRAESPSMRVVAVIYLSFSERAAILTGRVKWMFIVGTEKEKREREKLT